MQRACEGPEQQRRDQPEELGKNEDPSMIDVEGTDLGAGILAAGAKRPAAQRTVGKALINMSVGTSRSFVLHSAGPAPLLLAAVTCVPAVGRRGAGVLACR